MRIVVEGPDGAGKTELIRHLQTRFPELTPVVNRKEDKQDFKNWWIEQLSHQWQFPMIPIHDRFLYSELVYGPIIRGRLAVPRDFIFNLRDRLRQDSLLIYACPPQYEVYRNVEAVPQMSKVRETIGDLIDEYDRLMSAEAHHYGRRFHPYNYKLRSEPEAVTETVRGYLSGELT